MSLTLEHGMPAADLAKREAVRFNLVVGGSVGSNPYDVRTWSGSALHLVRALKKERALDRAIGLKLSAWKDAKLKAANFSLSGRVWRLKYYLDDAYRNALTETASAEIGRSESSSSLLQIGAMYDLPSATGFQVPCFSYHDGNVMEAVRSGWGLAGVPASTIDAAIQYERDLALKMNIVFTCSEYLRDSFIQDFGVPQNRVFNVGAGVNIDDVPLYQSDKNYDTREILFVGTDFDRKGGPELLSAFGAVRQALPDARLHIVGPRSLPRDAQSDGISFHGHLDKSTASGRKELFQLYSQASVFVMPSKYEPFGIAPLEAMIFQVPCIVTDGWALREMVSPGINGALVERGSVDDLIAVLLLLLRAPEALACMGKNARETVLNNYVWPQVVAKMRAAVVKR